MATIRRNYTYEEVKNNYEFKLVSGLLKRKFSWITKVDLNAEEINNYNIIFLILYVNPEKINEEYGWDYSWMLKNMSKESDEFIDKHLRNRQFPTISSFMDINYSDQDDIDNEIQKIFKSVKTNQIIPNDIKLQGGRSFSVDGFIISNKFIDKLKNEPTVTLESETYRKLFKKISASIRSDRNII
jgi:hypothetical protein